LYAPKIWHEKQGVYNNLGNFTFVQDGDLLIDELINKFYLEDINSHGFKDFINIEKYFYDLALEFFYELIRVNVNKSDVPELKKVVKSMQQDIDSNAYDENYYFLLKYYFTKEQNKHFEKLCNKLFYEVLQSYNGKYLKEFKSEVEAKFKASPLILLDRFFMKFLEHQRQVALQSIYYKKLKDWQIFSGIGNPSDDVLIEEIKSWDVGVVKKLKSWARLQPENFTVFAIYYPMDALVVSRLDDEGLLVGVGDFAICKADAVRGFDDFKASSLAQVGQLLSTLTGDKSIVLNVSQPDEEGDHSELVNVFCDAYGRFDDEARFLEGMFLAQEFEGSIVVRQAAALKIQVAGESKDTYRLYGAFIQEDAFNGLSKDVLKDSYSYSAATGNKLELAKGDYMMDWKKQVVNHPAIICPLGKMTRLLFYWELLLVSLGRSSVTTPLL